MNRTPARLAVVLAVCFSAGLPLLAQQGPDRSRPPAAGPAPALKLPPVQKRMLSNGLPVWLIESHEVPLVQVTLLVRAGSGDDPAGRFGVASLTAAMLDEGAGSRSALDIADAVEFLGATLATTSSFDSSAVRLNVPVARLGDALPIMADVALRPTFPATDLERVRQERLTALTQARDDVGAIAQLAFPRIVYGTTHRYGTSATGTEPTLRSLTQQDLRSFHSAFFQPANATIVVVGDVTAAAALPMLETQFGGWKNTSAIAHPAIPTAPQVARREVYIIDKPGAAQSQIRIGAVGVARSTPDYFTLEILNTILGGSFSSRLNLNLREEHQYTYGAQSGFDMRLSAGPFIATAGVQTDKTADALREFFKELDGISAPVSDEELTRAKNYVALGLPGDFETLRDLAVHLETLITYRLPDTYYEQYVGNIMAVTAPAIQKAASTYIQPSRLAVIIVGDRAVIEAGIRALDLGPVHVMTVAEALGS